MTRTSLGIATQQGTPSLLPISTRRCSATCCSLPTRRPSWRHAHHQEVAVGEAIPAEQTHRSVSCAARAARPHKLGSAQTWPGGRAALRRASGGPCGQPPATRRTRLGSCFLGRGPPDVQTRGPTAEGTNSSGRLDTWQKKSRDHRDHRDRSRDRSRGKVIRGNSRTKTDERSHGLIA
jgi:hypothetical protein